MDGSTDNNGSAITDRVRQAIDAVRALSTIADPNDAYRSFRATTKHFFQSDRTISLSRRNLERPQFRITRDGSSSGGLDPWAKTNDIPVLSGGLLAELVWAGELRVIRDLYVSEDDCAFPQLSGMRSLVAIPHFDDGEALNMVLRLWEEPDVPDTVRLPELVLISGLFGRAIKGLVTARTFQNTQSTLEAQYREVTSLTDVVIEQGIELKRYAAKLEERVRERTAALQQAHDDAIFMLAIASEEKDHHTGAHLRRIESLTRSLARWMGYEDAEATGLGRAAVLHDVGKLHVPDDVLRKPGPLTDEERAVIQQHTIAGERILADRPAFDMARRIAKFHHEDWNGRGYPEGLAGKEIPIEARIVHVVDVFDALVSERPYKQPWSEQAAVDLVRNEAGKMFDPKIARAFVDMIDQGGRPTSRDEAASSHAAGSTSAANAPVDTSSAQTRSHSDS